MADEKTESPPTKEKTMSTEISTQFTNEDIALIKETVCKGASDTEFKLFINQARTTGLNPLARQVFAVKRWDSQSNKEIMSIQVSIDGFRLIAERTGKYAGQVGPFWCGKDGVWKDVWVLDTPPVAAKVGAVRNDFKEPCWGIARFKSYAQIKKDGSLTRMWTTMPDVMISKCAESLALRKAFPQELSGLYTSDEMGQAESVKQEAAQIEPPKEMSLTDQAKEMAREVELSDTNEKLDAVLKRFSSLTETLRVKLPKWHEKLCTLVDAHRLSVNMKGAA